MSLTFAIEGALAGEHFVEHAAKCPDVCALVHGFAFRLLGRQYAAVPRITPRSVIAGEVIVGESTRYGKTGG